MDMQECTIYVRAYKRKTLQGVTSTTIKDLADIAAPPEVKAKVDTLRIFFVPDCTKNGRYIVTIIDIINAIWQEYPKADIQSVGDPDVVIEYVKKKQKNHNIWEWIKVAGLCLIVFAGATVAIMTYNTDTSLGKTFVILNRIFTGKQQEQPYLLTIPYSLGITAGILIFFNHLGFKKITDDPTPMQVEMKQYEKNVEDCEIESITDKRRGEP